MDEELQIRFLKREHMRKVLCVENDFENRETLYKQIEFILINGIECCFAFLENQKAQKLIFFQPSEQMNIYLKKEDVNEMKKILSSYASETTYYAYESGDL